MNNSCSDEGMHPYLKCEDDGLLMLKAGAWTAEKLDYLFRYLNIFTTSMRGKPWKGLHYIDLFSGPGKCKIRKSHRIVLGSPLLALTLKHPFSKYFFVELDQKTLDALKSRCNLSNRVPYIQFLAGDCNQVINNIVEQIQKIDRTFMEGRWDSSLNLAFLDPEGFELEWNTVAALGQINRMDLIVYYPQMGLTREMQNCFDNPAPTKIDTFFGTSEWRDIYRKNHSHHNLHRELMNLYEGRLRTLGYCEIKEDEPLIRSTTHKAPLYRLIFASKHPLGNEFWQQVTRRDLYGQKRLWE